MAFNDDTKIDIKHSSIRDKENVQEIGMISEDIFNLRPVAFNYRNDSAKVQQYGLIAEEVELVFPDLVTYNEEGEPESIKYDILLILCLNEIKRQKMVIQKMIKRIEKLEIG